MKELADNNFKFDENRRQFSKCIEIENSVGKGEIALYEQFLLFPQCFQKTCTADSQKPGLVWERLKQHVLTQKFEISKRMDSRNTNRYAGIRTCVEKNLLT